MRQREIVTAYFATPKSTETDYLTGALILDNVNGLTIVPATGEVNAYLTDEVTTAKSMAIRALVPEDEILFGAVDDYEDIDLTELSTGDLQRKPYNGCYLGSSGWKIAQILIQDDVSGADDINFLCIHESLTGIDLTSEATPAECSEQFANLVDLTQNGRYIFEFSPTKVYVITIMSQYLGDDDDGEDSTEERNYLTMVKVTEITRIAEVARRTREFVHLFSPNHPNHALVWDIYSYKY